MSDFISRHYTLSSLSTKELDSVLKRVAPFLKRADGVKVVGTFSSLPSQIEEKAVKQDAKDDVVAVFHKGIIYMVQGKISTPAKIEAAVFPTSPPKSLT